MFDAQPSKAQEVITTLPPFFDDDDLLHVSNSNEEDQYQHDLVIEAEPHECLDTDQHPFQTKGLSLDGLKISLMWQGMVL